MATKIPEIVWPVMKYADARDLIDRHYKAALMAGNKKVTGGHYAGDLLVDWNEPEVTTVSTSGHALRAIKHPDCGDSPKSRSVKKGNRKWSYSLEKIMAIMVEARKAKSKWVRFSANESVFTVDHGTSAAVSTMAMRTVPASGRKWPEWRKVMQQAIRDCLTDVHGSAVPVFSEFDPQLMANVGHGDNTKMAVVLNRVAAGHPAVVLPHSEVASVAKDLGSWQEAGLIMPMVTLD